MMGTKCEILADVARRSPVEIETKPPLTLWLSTGIFENYDQMGFFMRRNIFFYSIFSFIFNVSACNVLIANFVQIIQGSDYFLYNKIRFRTIFIQVIAFLQII